MNSKTYLKMLFSILALIMSLAVVYAVDFSTKYPIPITNRISFDAKLKFIREQIDPDKVDTIIVGSSLGMNNVLGSVLEESSQKVKYALNLSVYEATTLQVEQILELSAAFPNLKRIIYSTQYSDFPHAKRYKEYDPDLLRRYMRKELSPIELSKLHFNACNNLMFCEKRAETWEKKHTQSNKFTYLGFDKTGSVPLNIYSKQGVGGRWHLPHPGIMHHESFNAVERMAKSAQEKGIYYYVVHQHYREPLVEKHKSVRDALKYFAVNIDKIIKKYDGTLIPLQNLSLSDEYHADRSHLNDKGAALASKEIARVIDENER